MTRKRLSIASVVVVLAMVAVAAWVASMLPADAQLPTHWGMDGEPDALSDKWTALLMPAVIAGGISALMHFLPALEPRKGGLERSQGLYMASWAGLLVLMALVQLAVVATAFDWPITSTSLVLGGTGLLFILIGNQLGKSRSMYLVGIRTPWTLASEEVWIKTHRLAGKLMVAGGVLLALAAFLPLRPATLAALLFAVILAIAGVPILYSYILWRREQAAG
jgi:uncharacterized membrane protein